MYLVTIIIYVITVVFFVTMLGKKDKEFAKERKDYIDRIMAKNTTEYIKLSKKEENRILTDGEILGDDRIDGILN